MFPLLKYFSLTSFVFFLIVAVALAVSFNYQSTKSLISFGERSNVVLTQAVSNSVWPHFKEFAPLAAKLDVASLKAHPVTEKTHDMVYSHVSHTPILKVKIFDLHGKTLYSTDEKQIGVQKPAEYAGSVSARTGQVISKLSVREKFEAITETVYDRQVVSSYLPIRDYDKPGNAIVGVMEIYYDVTDQFAEIREQQVASFLFIFLMLMMLYAVLYLIVKRADRILFLQSLNLKTTLDKLQEKTDIIAKGNRAF